MEVDQQTEGNIEKLHVAEELRLAHGMKRFDGLELNQQTVLHKEVAAQGILEDQAFVFD